ncbi:hypothetical protein [Acutalibacter sp.]|uniref:hypothetical protein n=1 Tax=Acutalibacter sp. TaxID=1918636 RepID=UPI0021726020|nr:hypothetical protein [Acutalibacter sp.]
MKIEVLFPEICNLFGDLYNINYLEKCLPEVQRVHTPLTGQPLFLTEEPALVYLGPMSERSQEKVLEKLRPCRDRLAELIQNGAAFLLTGNAGEVFGSYIENEDGSRIEGLGLLPLHARRDMMHRHNSVFLGEFQGAEAMGFKSQFTMAWPEAGAQGLFPVKKGVGLNPQCPYEGLRQGNLFFTYLLGPVLLLNPQLAEALLAAMGAGGTPLALAPEMAEAYQARLRDFHEKV